MQNPINAIGTLIKNAVPTLDKSSHGWWRLVVLVFAIALAGSFYKAITPASIKLDDFQGRRPEHDCPVVDGVWVCEK
jgi:hypothetical protein